MNDIEEKQATLEYAVRLGDDALILGHRLSEWSSNAPFLEEDLALSNVALDYIGRARMFYSYAAELSGNGKSEDDFAYTRDEREFRNFLIVELPRGDFAFTMVRQLFVDLFNAIFLPRLFECKDERLSGIAEKAIKETRYHLRRSKEWVVRLGDGTQESHIRTQKAVDSLCGYSAEMFELDELEKNLAARKIAVDNTALKDEWETRLHDILHEAALIIPTQQWSVCGGRSGYHTENLGHLLTELQFLHRSMPGLQW